MAENKTSDELIREVELGVNKDDDLLEELVTEDMKIDTTENNVKYNDQNQRLDESPANENNQDTNNAIDENEMPVQKKQSKIFRILISVIAVLSIILTIGIILYFTGFFDEEEIKKETPVEKIVQKEEEFEFDDSIIDENKLNKKLTMLTKDEIMEKEALEEEKRKKEEELKRIELEKKLEEERALEEKIKAEQAKKDQEQKLLEEAKKLEETKKAIEEEKELLEKQKEEFLRLQEEQKTILEEQKLELLNKLNEANTVVEEPINETTPVVEEVIEEAVSSSSTYSTFLPFINVATIKGELFKSYLDKIESIQKDVSLCRDDKNRIEVYVGPFDSNAERNKTYDRLLESGFKEAYLIEFTQEEYDKRCKY